jgi:DNA-binding GntR family transcriptional regulator
MISRKGRMVSNNVYERITGMILRDELRPGARINIDQIAHRLGVSATPVREALARLESDGLVTKVHLKGYSTAEVLGRRQLEELYELRFRLEPYSAGRAAAKATQADIDSLHAELASCTVAPTRSDYDSYKRFSAHDARLHALILEIAGNSLISQAIERTHFHLHAFRLSYDASAGSHTLDEHSAVVQAIAAGDCEAAVRAMSNHLETSRNRLLPKSSDESSPFGDAATSR